MARSKATDSEMIVMRSEQYHKKMNLVGDLASCVARADTHTHFFFAAKLVR